MRMDSFGRNLYINHVERSVSLHPPSGLYACTICVQNLRDVIFVDCKLLAKTAKVTSLKNLCVYGVYICIRVCAMYLLNIQLAVNCTDMVDICRPCICIYERHMLCMYIYLYSTKKH